jgi:hypothetical protein
MAMYYVMSVPELMVLFLVLSLWLLSIFFCFKRYEKISTIERADLPQLSKQIVNTSNNQTSLMPSTTSASKMNATKSSSDNLSAMNWLEYNKYSAANNSDTRTMIISRAISANLLNSSSLAALNNTNNPNGVVTNAAAAGKNQLVVKMNSINETPMLELSNGDEFQKATLVNKPERLKSNTSNFLIRQNALSFAPYDKNLIVFDRDNRVNAANYGYGVVTYEKTRVNHHHILKNQFNIASYNTHSLSSKQSNLNQYQFEEENPSLKLKQMQKSKFKQISQQEILNENPSNSISDKQSSQYFLSINSETMPVQYESSLLKSSSEPAFKELINQQQLSPTSYIEDNELLSSKSIDDDNHFAQCSYQDYKSPNCVQNYQILKKENDFSQLGQTTKLANRMFIIKKRDSLLDPSLIPKVIRKSLLDLHKKSVSNLSQRQLTATNNPSNSNSGRPRLTSEKQNNGANLKIIDYYI